MSHGRHNASSEIAHLLAEVKRSTPEEILEFYGIEIAGDNTVYDSTYDKKFNNIRDWATYTVQQEADEWDDDEDDTGKWNDNDD